MIIAFGLYFHKKFGSPVIFEIMMVRGCNLVMVNRVFETVGQGMQKIQRAVP
ncbi:MAG: hypothetical protein JST48_01105 [Bacteroidetes bacterium]|nr:hypothetical protein [Bacteroidota bacterium]